MTIELEVTDKLSAIGKVQLTQGCDCDEDGCYYCKDTRIVLTDAGESLLEFLHLCKEQGWL